MIRMISGTTRIGNRTYSASDGCFETDAETEARLIARGVAVAVNGGVATPIFHGDERDRGSENTPECSGVESADDVPAYDENTSAKELREIGNKVGIKFPFGINKEKMRELLDEYFYGDAPDLSASEPLV